MSGQKSVLNRKHDKEETKENSIHLLINSTHLFI